jgi:8-oxo-dGTP diphosphatase
VEGVTEILLVHRRRPVLWALPKGTPNAGETLAETALREAREETGVEVEIEEPLGEITYFFVRDRIRFRKTVHFFLMRPVGGSMDEHDHEFDEVRWTPIDEALRLMNYATERDVVDRAADRLAGAAGRAAQVSA